MSQEIRRQLEKLTTNKIVFMKSSPFETTCLTANKNMTREYFGFQTQINAMLKDGPDVFEVFKLLTF